MRSLWRISNHCDLSGVAGQKSDGRWHTARPGKRIVYLAEHAAVALIEVLVHLKGQARFFPNSFQLLKAIAADTISVEALPITAIPSNWRENSAHTQTIGDNWLAARRSALFAVPSAPSPESTNYLFNPLHPDARGVQIEWCRWIEYDKRLFQTIEHVR